MDVPRAFQGVGVSEINLCAVMTGKVEVVSSQRPFDPRGYANYRWTINGVLRDMWQPGVNNRSVHEPTYSIRK